ncbi:hypothetical protein C8P70_10443 [Myroides indicus]|uniref:Uncharacterized protein n=1 Tax=Myroides indicus TaxID=1323422 RepID=A0A4R7F7X0_9FLAO|nr:hypothetical protein C8P70_10443 [Myroides indicus]
MLFKTKGYPSPNILLLFKKIIVDNYLPAAIKFKADPALNQSIWLAL